MDKEQAEYIFIHGLRISKNINYFLEKNVTKYVSSWITNIVEYIYLWFKNSVEYIHPWI